MPPSDNSLTNAMCDKYVVRIYLRRTLNGYQKKFGICTFKEMEIMLLQVPSYY